MIDKPSNRIISSIYSEILRHIDPLSNLLRYTSDLSYYSCTDNSPLKPLVSTSFKLQQNIDLPSHQKIKDVFKKIILFIDQSKIIVKTTTEREGFCTIIGLSFKYNSSYTEVTYDKIWLTHTMNVLPGYFVINRSAIENNVLKYTISLAGSSIKGKNV